MLVTPAALAGEIDYRDLNLALVDGHVVPRYEALAASADALDGAARAMCSAPDAVGLDALHAAYHDMMDAWMGIQHVRFGPVELFMRGFRLQFWPDRRNNVGKEISGALAQTDLNILGLDSFSNKSVAIQGLPALERLLFDNTIAATSFAATSVRCHLVIAITFNLKIIATEIVGEWRDPETGFRAVMAEAGPDNAFFLDDREATLALFKSLHGGLERIVTQRLARPLGESIDNARPKRAESWRSHRSLRNILVSLDGLEALYLGEGAVGFAIALAEMPDGIVLDARIRGTFATARARIDAVSRDLSEAVADPAARPSVVEAMADIDALREIVARDLAAALGLQLGFNALDGD